MPGMQSTPIAIFASDIHLSQKPPALRAEEPDWFEAMARPLKEVRKLAQKFSVPVIIAGDIFDHWKCFPELINFALEEMPDCYAIPGQHDLPHHSYDDIEKSAYWTLVEAGVIQHLEPPAPTIINNLQLYGFHWGLAPEPCFADNDLIKVAVVHEYCWMGKYKYPKAPKANHLSNFKLSGYDIAVFGDNHIGWVKDNVCNCGGFMRRHSPDMDRQPFVGILMDDLVIKKHLLDTSDDIYCRTDSEDIVEAGAIEFGDFTEGLLNLKSAKDLDFSQVLKRYCKQEKVDRDVIQIIRGALDDS